MIRPFETGVSRRLEPAAHRTLPDQIANAIVKAAAEGKFALGERLVEPDLARDLGVSRIPVREALKLLESQGIVVSSPHRGMRLMSVDREQLRQILVVRSSLERLAIRESAARPGGRGSRQAEEALAAMREAAENGDPYQIAASDVAFHRALCVASGNEVILRFWETLSNKLKIIFGVAARDKEFHRLHQNHCRLYETVVSSPLPDAEAALDFHIVEQTQWRPLDTEPQLRSAGGGA